MEPGLTIHLRGQTSGAHGAVYLFHGEEWHGGWPPGHLKVGTMNSRGDWYAALYKVTLETHRLYKEQGYRVFAVWGLEYAKACRAKAPEHILQCVVEV